MAHTRWINGRAYTIWTEGGKRKCCRANTTDPRVAEAHRQSIERLYARLGTVESRHGPMTASQACDVALGSIRATGRTKETIQWYKSILGPFQAVLGQKPFESLTRADVADWLDGQAGIWGPTRRHMAYRALRYVLNVNRKRGQAVPDILDALRAPKPQRKARRVLSPVEIDKLLDATKGTQAHMLVALSALAGLRRHEAETLTWGDVDLKAATMLVTRHKTHTQTQLTIGPRLMAILEAAKTPLAGAGDTVVEYPREQPWPMYRDLRAACKAAGLPYVPPHSLRASCATNLWRGGATPAVVGHVLGHAPGSATPLLYCHTTADEAAEAMRRNG